MAGKIVPMIARRFTNLHKVLQQAHINLTPEQFVRKNLTLSFYISLTFTILLFFLFDKMAVPLGILLFILPILFFFVFMFLMNTPRVYIRKREREINQEVLFAGRYILVKLDSGVPLFNALIDATKSYGIAGKYFKEIVDDINLGTPIEVALKKARESSPSKYFKLILSELITSLKTGVDVAVPLRGILQQITKEQMLEIKEYSKKLNAFMLLYLVVGAVLPSLGMTMVLVFAGFLGMDFGSSFIFIVLFILAVLQFMFLSMFRSIRPTVNL